MIFKKPSKKLPEQLFISLDDTPIQVTKTVKLLGVTLDQHFTMGPHIDDTIKKCHGLLGVMKRSASVLPKDLIKLIYQSIVRSHLEYCSTTFLKAANTHLSKLDTIQKIAARIALGMGPQEHSAPLLSRLGWEPLSLRREEHAKSLVQNIETGKSHPYFENYFSSSPDTSLGSMGSSQGESTNHTTSELFKKRFKVFGKSLTSASVSSTEVPLGTVNYELRGQPLSSSLSLPDSLTYTHSSVHSPTPSRSRPVID